MKLAGARALVAGLGRSGRAAVEALQRVGVEVTTFDDAGTGDIGRSEDINYDMIDFLVASPGLPPTHPVLASATCPVISEIELAWWLRAKRSGGAAPWLGVTGTNGKTTTVGMLASIMAAAGERVAEIGNIGTPAVEAVTNPDIDVFVVELSSFQLHFTTSVSLQAAAVLNVAPDHLDWHGSIENYASDKGRIYHQTQRVCVYNVADPRGEQLVRDADVVDGATAVGFTLGVPSVGQIGLVDDVLVERAFSVLRHTHGQEVATVADLEHLAGPDGRVAGHVIQDALVAAALGLAHGVTPEQIRVGLRNFAPGAHRITTVAQVGAVVFVDDSKATNAHAAGASLAAFDPGSVVWIAGGLAKGATFDDLVIARADRLRAVVLIGIDREPWRSALARHAPEVRVVEVDDRETGNVMSEAVAEAYKLATDPDLGSGPAVVLLAPAAASMDQFTSYADRGDQFAVAAGSLVEDL